MMLEMCENCAIAMPKEKMKWWDWVGAVLCPTCHRYRWKVSVLKMFRPPEYNGFPLHLVERGRG